MAKRGLIPIALAVGFGIANGYVTFNPAFEDLEVKKMKEKEASEAANLGPNITEVNVSPVSNGTAYPSIDSQTPQEVAEQKSGNWWPFGQSKA